MNSRAFFLDSTQKTRLKRVALGLFAAILIAVASLAALVLSRDLGAIRDNVIETVQAETGGKLSIAASKTLFWPNPRVVLDGVTFTLADGSASISVPRAILAIDVFDMLDGMIDGPNITLEAPEIRVAAGPLARFHASPRSLTDIADRLSNAFEGRKRLSALRLAVRKGRVIFEAGQDDKSDLLLDPVEARLKFSASRGAIEFFARRSSEIRPLEIAVTVPTRQRLVNRQKAPVKAMASGFGSRAAFNGTMTRAPDLALNGTFEASIQDALERALGFSQSEGRSKGDSTLAISGTLSLDPRGGGMEGLKITRGSGSLTGIAALRENNGRWGVSSTLAGDLVDGTATHAMLSRLRNGDGSWSSKSIDANPAPGLDLDIRLSTKQFKLGRIVLENAGLSVFTRAGRAEFAIADARHGTGSIKARVAIAERTGGQDVRLLISGDKLDASAFLDAAFGLSRISGQGHFVFQAETHGAHIAQLVANLNGSGSVDIRGGEVAGIDLNRLMLRSESLRPEAALLTALGGKSSFEVLTTNLAIRQGKVEPVGSILQTSRVDGQLDGFVDLVAQQHSLAMILRRRQDQQGQQSEFFAFRIGGALLSPTLKPDLSLILKRS